jgi:hypothetical protein
MKRILAGLLTTIIMGVMTWTALSRRPASSPPTTGSGPDSRIQNSKFQSGIEPDGATACIEGLLAAARAGDVDAYLRAFDGALLARLVREADEIGRDAFAIRLRRASEARKGHAIFAPEPDGERVNRATITVESTFTDRIERQTFRLDQANGHWLVTEIESAREHLPKTPLGSLATYNEPEGAPVPVAAGSDEPGSDEIVN